MQTPRTSKTNRCWDLPPPLRLEQKDRPGYLAIGESDRVTLKFTKPTTEAQAQYAWRAEAARWLKGRSQ